MLYNVVDLAGKLTLIQQNQAIIILYVLQFTIHPQRSKSFRNLIVPIDRLS